MLISVMICESMAEAESLPETEPIPRYQWDNIVNIVIYGITQHLLLVYFKFFDFAKPEKQKYSFFQLFFANSEKKSNFLLLK